MSSYDNMSDEELLKQLNILADKFDNDREKSNQSAQYQTQQQQFNPQPEPTRSAQEWDNQDFDIFDTDANEREYINIPDEEIPIENVSYTTNENGEFIINPRPTQSNKNVFRMTPGRNWEAEKGRFSFLYKRRKRMFESNYGTSFYYKESWESLIKSIVARFPDKRAINAFAIKGGILYAKQLEVDPHDFEDEELGITVYDLIEYHTLFKLMPGIETLVIDDKATERLILTYGGGPQDIWKVFQEENSLGLLRIKTRNGWQDFTRTDYAKNADKLAEYLKESRAKIEIQHKMDVLNPRKGEWNKGKIYSAKKLASDMTKNSFGAAKEHFMVEKSPHLLRAGLYATVGAITGAFWIVTAGLNAGQRILSKRDD